jgi:cell division protein FtsW (lipid II flippase)
VLDVNALHCLLSPESRPFRADGVVAAETATDMLTAIIRHMEERRRLVPLYAVALSVVLLGLDFMTRPHVGFSMTFLIPVALAAWFSGKAWGVLLGIALPLLHASFFLIRTTPQTTLEIAVNAAIPILVLSSFALLSRTHLREAMPERLLSVCAWCKRVRHEDESWISAEDYLYLDKARSVTSGICPDCREDFQ